jgi:prolyl-tRNA synthetase
LPATNSWCAAVYIRQLAAGVYSYMFLAQRSILKIIGIVREEMDAIGAQEMLLPRQPGRDLARNPDAGT